MRAIGLVLHVGLGNDPPDAPATRLEVHHRKKVSHCHLSLMSNVDE
jgi:hypothetical protein